MDICRERHFQAFVCDALAVPIRSGACDACISIAVIHHFATAVSTVCLSPRPVAVVAGNAHGCHPLGNILAFLWVLFPPCGLPPLLRKHVEGGEEPGRRADLCPPKSSSSLLPRIHGHSTPAAKGWGHSSALRLFSSLSSASEPLPCPFPPAFPGPSSNP